MVQEWSYTILLLISIFEGSVLVSASIVLYGARMVILIVGMVFLHCVFYVFFLLLRTSARMVLLSVGIVIRCG